MMANDNIDIKYLNSAKNWHLTQNNHLIIEWTHKNKLYSAEIQECNGEYELEFFKCDSKGFIVKQEIIMSSDILDETIEFALDWMKQCPNGKW